MPLYFYFTDKEAEVWKIKKQPLGCLVSPNSQILMLIFFLFSCLIDCIMRQLVFQENEASIIVIFGSSENVTKHHSIKY